MLTPFPTPTGPKPVPDSQLSWWVSSKGWLHLLNHETLEEWSAPLHKLPTMMDLVIRTYGGVPEVSEEV
jgi:hypothetical protein